MSYQKNEWQSGDVVTSDKLNHMEDGIAGGTLVIGGFSYDGNTVTGTADKTWQEIDNALAASVICVIVYVREGGHSQLIIDSSGVSGAKYGITANSGEFTALTDSADGYPEALQRS